MTTRTDIPRLAASLSVLGTELEQKGQPAWDSFDGWTEGPRRAPGEAEADVCTCGHTSVAHYQDRSACMFQTTLPGAEEGSVWMCPCVRFEQGSTAGPASEDRKVQRQQAASASKKLNLYREKLTTLDTLVQELNVLLDVACPPNVSEMKNRRTGDLEPVTSADVAASGWCSSCWRNDNQMVVITVRAGTSNRYYRDYCRWCGDFHSQHKIEPPVELLKARHSGHRLSESEVDKAVKAAIAAATPKKAKKRKGKKAA